MRPQTFRQSVTLAIVMTAGWGAINHFLADPAERSIATSLLALPLFFTIILLTMRLTNRVAVAIAGRVERRRGAPPEASPARPPRPSARPDHARRRRGRRRSRGGPTGHR